MNKPNNKLANKYSRGLVKQEVIYKIVKVVLVVILQVRDKFLLIKNKRID
jgi:hypothetical protein